MSIIFLLLQWKFSYIISSAKSFQTNGCSVRRICMCFFSKTVREKPEHNWPNEEWREKFSLQKNAKKWWKSGKKYWHEIRKIWHFEISHLFGKHILTSPYEYSNEGVEDVISSQFIIIIIHAILKNFHFWWIQVKINPVWQYVKINIISHLFRVDRMSVLLSFS